MSEAETVPRKRCTVCGASRLTNEDGSAGVCSLVPGRDGTGGCPDPLRDVEIESGKRVAANGPHEAHCLPDACKYGEKTCPVVRRVSASDQTRAMSDLASEWLSERPWGDASRDVRNHHAVDLLKRWEAVRNSASASSEGADFSVGYERGYEDGCSRDYRPSAAHETFLRDLGGVAPRSSNASLLQYPASPRDPEQMGRALDAITSRSRIGRGSLSVLDLERRLDEVYEIAHHAAAVPADYVAPRSGSASTALPDLRCPDCGKMLDNHVIVARHSTGTCEETMTGPPLTFDALAAEVLLRMRTGEIDHITLDGGAELRLYPDYGPSPEEQKAAALKEAINALGPSALSTPALERSAAEAQAAIAPMIVKAAEAFLAFERLLRAEVEAQILASDERQAIQARESTNAAREKLLAFLTHPILISRDGREDDRQEIAYLRETCTRQQKELSALRSSTSSLSGQRSDLEASNRTLRLETEDLARKLALAEEGAESEWPVFEENSMVHFIADARRGTDVPICAGDTVLVVAKAMVMRLKTLRLRGGS